MFYSVFFPQNSWASSFECHCAALIYVNRSVFANFFGLLKFMRMQNNNSQKKNYEFHFYLQLSKQMIEPAFCCRARCPILIEYSLTFAVVLMPLPVSCGPLTVVRLEKKKNQIGSQFGILITPERIDCVQMVSLNFSFKLNINKNFRIKTFQLLFIAIDNRASVSPPKPKSSFIFCLEKCAS